MNHGEAFFRMRKNSRTRTTPKPAIARPKTTGEVFDQLMPLNGMHVRARMSAPNNTYITPSVARARA
jgi:hypothetical protein